MKCRESVYRLTLVRVAVVLALTVFGTSAAWGDRPMCDGFTFPDEGICFLPNGDFIGFFFDADGEFFGVLVLERDSDIARLHADGRFFIHNNVPDSYAIYCPFFPTLAEFFNPPDDCISGTAHGTANGFLDETGALTCPFEGHFFGTGERVGDGASFDFSGVNVTVPRGRSACREVANEVQANEN